MTRATCTYLGNLRCETRHEESGDNLLTDAPRDNQGEGAHFSPTDLVGTALLSCIITTMGIVAKRFDIDMTGLKGTVEKTMTPEGACRIARLAVVIDIPLPADHPEKARFERAATHCPVHLSLHPDIDQDIALNWLG